MNFFTARDGVVMFSHNFKQFCILVQITTKGPDLLQNRSGKVPILPESPFFPLLQHISAQSPDGKILYRKHCVLLILPPLHRLLREVYLVNCWEKYLKSVLSVSNWTQSILLRQRLNCSTRSTWNTPLAVLARIYSAQGTKWFKETTLKSSSSIWSSAGNQKHSSLSNI